MCLMKIATVLLRRGRRRKRPLSLTSEAVVAVTVFLVATRDDLIHGRLLLDSAHKFVHRSLATS